LFFLRGLQTSNKGRIARTMSAASFHPNVWRTLVPYIATSRQDCQFGPRDSDCIVTEWHATKDDQKALCARSQGLGRARIDTGRQTRNKPRALHTFPSPDLAPRTIPHHDRKFISRLSACERNAYPFHTLCAMCGSKGSGDLEIWKCGTVCVTSDYSSCTSSLWLDDGCGRRMNPCLALR